jgi:hypothetical protein
MLAAAPASALPRNGSAAAHSLAIAPTGATHSRLLFRRQSRAFATSTSSSSTSTSSTSTPAATRELTQAEIAAYWRDGYVFLRGFYSQAEADAILAAVETDKLVHDKKMEMKDEKGRVSRLTLWSYIQPDTTYGAVAAGRRMVHAARSLLRGYDEAAEPYHFHTKLMLKTPKSGGAWSWHSDYGYWARLGTLDPNLMMSAMVAIDTADLSNGCLQVLKGSHKLGRLDHGAAGEQAGVEARMLAKARAKFPTVDCIMAPGDVLFFHSNTLHASGPNLSDKWRRAMIVAWNGTSNAPFEDNGISPMPHALKEVDDTAILAMGARGHQSGSEAAADFLEEKRNVDKFAGDGIEKFDAKVKKA